MLDALQQHSVHFKKTNDVLIIWDKYSEAETYQFAFLKSLCRAGIAFEWSGYFRRVVPPANAELAEILRKALGWLGIEPTQTATPQATGGSRL